MNLNDLAELEHEELKMLSVTGFRDDMAAEFKDHEGAIDMHLIHPDVASQGSDIDDPSHSVFNFEPKELKLKKGRLCQNLFGGCFSKPDTNERRGYKYNSGQFSHVKILSLTDTNLKASTPGFELQVQKHLGIVDVTIYRRIYMDSDLCSLSVSSPDNNRHITSQIEKAVTEINEIMRSKVSAIRGNCILSYRLQILWLKEEFHYNS